MLADGLAKSNSLSVTLPELLESAQLISGASQVEGQAYPDGSVWLVRLSDPDRDLRIVFPRPWSLTRTEVGAILTVAAREWLNHQPDSGTVHLFKKKPEELPTLSPG